MSRPLCCVCAGTQKVPRSIINLSYKEFGYEAYIYGIGAKTIVNAGHGIRRLSGRLGSPECSTIVRSHKRLKFASTGVEAIEGHNSWGFRQTMRRMGKGLYVRRQKVGGVTRIVQRWQVVW